MADGLSNRYQDLLTGSYDCIDRIVLNGYFRPGQTVLLISLTPQGWRRSQRPCLSQPQTVGRLSRLCERWIYTTCLCFALDLDEQNQSGFHYQYSNYQIEYSRNLIFQVGGHMDQVFQALIDRSRRAPDLKTVKTILGYKRRPKYRKRKRWSAEWTVTVENPTADMIQSEWAYDSRQTVTAV
jgi:hypothetical protein